MGRRRRGLRVRGGGEPALPGMVPTVVGRGFGGQATRCALPASRCGMHGSRRHPHCCVC